MKSMTQVRQASEALAAADDSGFLKGTVVPAVFGCPHGHAARIVTSPLPFGTCSDCGSPMSLLDRRLAA